ncbi:MAG: hypothetical protein VW971_02210, partial [Cryomorphaceae bacterium]
MKKLWLVLAVISGPLFAQNTSFVSKKMTAEFVGTIDPAQTSSQALGFLYPTGAPVPGGEGYKSFIAQQKQLQDYR